MKENLCIITGPTGVGKTRLSLEIAKSLKGEIISSDSMQIYKHMDIGTAKVLPEEMEGIPHHLIDVVSPDEDFSVSDFKDRAQSAIGEINSHNSLPIVVGGTGLYINSLVYDLNFARVAYNEEIRSKYERIAEDKGLDYLHSLLESVDTISAEKINKNDRKRVIRALEIYDITGKTMSEYNKDFRKENKDYNLAMICLTMDRPKLYERINNRVDLMFDKGLLEEVKSLLDMGYDPESIALQGIGYKEIIMYLRNDLTLEESTHLIKQKSRNYAKRQLTWFRRDDRIKWINKDDFDDFESISQFVKSYILEKIK